MLVTHYTVTGMPKSQAGYESLGNSKQRLTGTQKYLQSLPLTQSLRKKL